MKYLESRKPTKAEILRYEFKKFEILATLANESGLQKSDPKKYARLNRKAKQCFENYKEILITG